MQINSYYNGVFSDQKDIRITLADRALFFGDGIYDAAIGRNGKIFMLDEHVERFFSNANAVDIPINMSKEELKSILLFLAQKSEYDCYFIYFQLTRFSEKRVHSYPITKKSNLLITVTEQNMPSTDKALKLTLSKDIRHEMCNIKTLNLLPAVLASHKAESLGKDETVFHRNGIVTECSHSNVHIISDSTLITHPLDNHILPGISRKHLIEVCKRIGISVKEREYSVYELYRADAVLVSSSSKLALPASSVDYICFPGCEAETEKVICREMLSDFVKMTKNDTTIC